VTPPPIAEPAAEPTPFSRGWMGPFLLDAVRGGDVKGALEKADVSIVEFFEARDRDPLFDAACVDLDNAIEALIPRAIKYAAASGSIPASRILVKGLGELKPGPSAEDRRLGGMLARCQGWTKCPNCRRGIFVMGTVGGKRRDLKLWLHNALDKEARLDPAMDSGTRAFVDAYDRGEPWALLLGHSHLETALDGSNLVMLDRGDPFVHDHPELFAGIPGGLVRKVVPL
jgi:hypothetical protein